MTTMASQITSLTVVNSTLYSDADQRKHQSSASLALVWGIHRDRTKGQLRGKCFHLMTSSWSQPCYHTEHTVEPLYNTVYHIEYHTYIKVTLRGVLLVRLKTRKDTPYLTLIGELRSVFYKCFAEKTTDGLVRFYNKRMIRQTPRR